MIAAAESLMSGKSEAPPDLGQQFGRNLRRVRKRVAMSQGELAAAASLHRTEIGLIERGHRVVRIDTLIKLAGGLGVSPLELLEGIEWTAGDPGRRRFSIDGGAAAK